MATLAEKIRESRRLEIIVDGVTFFCTRPTVDDFYAAVQKSSRDVFICKSYVVGWNGMKESQLIPGGSEEEVAFDANLWAEAIPDLPNFYTPLAKQIFKAVTDFIAARAEQKKNLKPGSKPGK